MATKLGQSEANLNVDEALELIEKTMERVKSLYEQYFLGIQKQPPTFIHNDLERKLRDLQQSQIRNTALRYRYATLQQKFSSYNSYWRRTLRQIETGTYGRSLAKLGRKAAESGQEIPEEILAKMPKRMREQVRRDREAAIALAERRNQLPQQQPNQDDGDFYEEFAKPAGRVDGRGAHLLSADDADIDLDAYFAQVAAEDEHTTSGPPPQEFEELATPPVAVVPSGPAGHRAASLGGMPRAQSPAVRAQTNPGLGAPTPPAFRPMGSGVVAAGPRTGTQRAVTEPDPYMTEADEQVIGVQPLGRARVPMPSNPSQSGPSQAGQSGSMPAQQPGQMRAQTQGQRPIQPEQSGSMPAQPGQRPSQPLQPNQSGSMPAQRPSQPGQLPAMRPSQPLQGQPPQSTPAMRPVQPGQPGAPRVPMPSAPSGQLPAIPSPLAPSQGSRGFAPSQGVRPNPIAPGSMAAKQVGGVETMQGPFAREPSVVVPPRRSKRDTDVDMAAEETPTSPVSPALPAMHAPMRPVPTPPTMKPVPTPARPLSAATPVGRTTPTGGNPAIGRTTPTGGNPAIGRPQTSNAVPTPTQRPPVRPTPTPTPTPGARPPAQRPPPGMTDDDVNALYTKYVKAKEMVGEQTGPQTFGKLLNTINAQAPKIMEQYKAKGVDFSVVVKDNQVIIKAKPKP